MKSAVAVVAGLVFIVVVTRFADLLLELAGVYPSTGKPISDALAALATAYRVVISMAGAWLTARLAPERPLMHAVILGFVGTVLGLIGVLVTWNMGLGPRWYPIALTVLAIPQCWLGGKLREMAIRP